MLKRLLPVVLSCFFMAALLPASSSPAQSSVSAKAVDRAIAGLIKTHGEAHRFRVQRGVAQAAGLWRAGDGDESQFIEFCNRHFIADPGQRDRLLFRLESNLEAIHGHFHRIKRHIDDPTERAGIEALPLDVLFAQYSPGTHMEEDMFKSKVAFAVLLNFPRYTLQEKLEKGPGWSRKQWAAASAGDLFVSRVPGDVNRRLNAALAQINLYVYSNNIYLGKLLDKENKTLFPDDLRLIVHWGLRDQLTAAYNQPGGQEKQEMIYRVMQRILDQSIPAQVIDNPDFYWNPFTNRLYKKTANKLVQVPVAPEKDARYRHWFDSFKAQRMLDTYYLGNATMMERSFDMERKIPGKKVEEIFLTILESPLAAKMGRVIEKRLGRPLRPYDVWYDGFKTKPDLDKKELDRRLQQIYPDAAALEKDIPRMLEQLGFGREKAAYIGERIVVDPTKGMGHAMAPLMRGDKAHLRLRVPKAGINFMYYNLGVHEMGHNVEQVCSLHLMDHYLLKGIPNYAFTESFAFMFGSRALELMGVEDPSGGDPLKAVETFRFAFLTSGVALAEMRIWRWMYRNPDASVSEFQAAALGIAKEIWNRYFEPVFGGAGEPLLIIYNHLLGGYLYFPDYPMGLVIAFQLESFMKGKILGTEIERMCRTGAVTPGHWMQQAVGAPISPGPLLEAAKKALDGMPE